MHPPANRNQIFLACLFLLCLPFFEGRGQTVIFRLQNGDRISGQIVAEDTNNVTVKTAWGDAIKVKIGEIQSREALKTATNSVTATAPAPGTAAVVTPTPVAPKKPKHWVGEVQLGVDLVFSERNRQLYSGRVKTTYTYERSRNLFDYQFAYGRTEGVVSDNRMFGSLKNDYDLTRKFYVYNISGAGYDETRKVNFRYEVGPGVGYHVIQHPKLLFNTEAGVNYQDEYRADDTRSEIFFYRFAEDAVWKLTPRLSWDEKFEFFPRVDDFGQYRFRFETNLRYTLVNNLTFVLTLQDQYDTGPPEGVPQNDLQVRSAIGVKF